MAVETVANYLKCKHPQNISPLIDTALSGKSPDLGDVQKNLGGLFGK
jgi:hypothetical protein